MDVVRTVLGDVPPESLGVVDMHDHLIITGGPAVARESELRLDSVDDAAAEAAAFGEAGGNTIIDAMPSGCGRDASALAEVSRRTGVQVVATAGFHKQEYYDDLHWARRYPVELLVEVLTAECVKGIDRWDSAGPIAERTAVRPGLLKIATGYNRVRPFELRAIDAVSAVHRATRMPVMTHADHGTYALRQLDLLEERGVPAARIAVSHLDRNPDPGLHREVAARGAHLIYDGVGRENYRPLSAVASLLHMLLDEGRLGQLMLGADIAKRSLRRIAGGIGTAGLLDETVPAFVRDGVPEDALRTMLVANPARFLSIEGEMQ